MSTWPENDPRYIYAKDLEGYSFKPYDVLEIKRPDGRGWLDFSTLRDNADLGHATRYMKNPSAWRDGDDSPSKGYEFRIRKNGYV